MAHFEASVFFFTWGSCSSPSGSLKSSSAPNFKMADNSSLLKGVELKSGKIKMLNLILKNLNTYSTFVNTVFMTDT